MGEDQEVQTTTTDVAVDRKAARIAALEQAVATVASFDAPEEIETTQIVDSLRGMIAAFSPRTRPAGQPRLTLIKADPADVAAYFASTGLTRKQLAAATGVSTSVIATVQNEKGDRWSLVTFEHKKTLVAAWMEAHADEIEAERLAVAAEALAKQQAADARAAKASAKASAKPAPAAKPKSSAKKPGRPSAAARQANRKQAPVAVAATA